MEPLDRSWREIVNDFRKDNDTRKDESCIGICLNDANVPGETYKYVTSLGHERGD